MVFISRLIAIDRFGVVDTDTDEESVASKKQLQEAIKAGANIHGAEDIERIKSYQPVETKSLLQVKYKTLYNIDITTYKSTITGVTWNKATVAKPVEVRLSDFGKLCGPYLIMFNERCADEKVIIVLDQKITFGKNTFWIPPLGNIADFGLIIDARELSNDVALTLYKSVHFTFAHNWAKNIIDREYRKKRFIELIEGEVS